MKIISDKWQVPSDTNRQPARGESISSCRPSPVTCRRQRGVALVITLILLSVTLVMALAFLAISNRERGSVTAQTDTTTARLGADAGLADAEAQIAANVLTSTNPYSFGLLVSTNYLNLANAPAVYLSNIVTHAMENRFYLDLNRNGMDDPNGYVNEVNNAGVQIDTGVFEVGDPEWVYVLEHPDQPFGINNPYIARFAYIALPVGNSLDLNAIHNQALSPGRTTKSAAPLAQDYYFRNQGVASWELNLAAFLTDLNTNEWDPISDAYNYLQPNFINTGRGFEDAFAVLTNRYAGNYNSLAPVGGPNGIFTTANAFPPFQNNIDAYSSGPLQTTPADINESGLTLTWLWPGANNTNHYFTPQELFNPAETAAFGAHLLDAGTNFFGGTTVSSYDRYTLYRMLSQLGTDTTPDSGKMNLNYDNLTPYLNGLPNVNGVASVTNFIAWQPLTFFTNAADRMLKTYTKLWMTSYVPTNGGAALLATVNTNFVATFNATAPFGVTGIPVWVSNRFVYTPAVQRVLQLAANIYDATTGSHYPSVFRPLFTASTNGNVFITGYISVTNVSYTNDLQLAQPIDAATLSALSATTNLNNQAVNVYGVPWIIGAKKGLPNFNEFEMENIFQLTRKLSLTRASTTAKYAINPGAYAISQQLTLALTNTFGIECWNSYRADYINPVVIRVTDANTMTLTNDEGLSFPISFSYTNAAAVSDWPGYGPNPLPNSQSFIYGPLLQGEAAVPMWIYTFVTNNNNLAFVWQAPSFFVTNKLMPHWSLLISNRLQVVMLESNSVDTQIHVIDYVQLIGPEKAVDLTAAITNLYDTYYDRNNFFQKTVNNGYNDMWDPIVNNGTPLGMANQIGVSAQLDPIILTPYWSQMNPSDVTNQTAAFRAFLGYGALPGLPPGTAQYISVGTNALTLQAPYTPTALISSLTLWEVNDPLVHYLASDLSGSTQYTQPQKTEIALTFGVLNDRYFPWGGNVQYPSTDPRPYDHTIKDPLMYSSDYWDFPTNTLPATGVLGRVHRGTPWQTVYLKSADVVGTDGIGVWANWTGNQNYFDAFDAAPVQDRLLFDLFTTAFNDNASRGTLSVNVGSTLGEHNLAAWSALFSGIVVPTNFNAGPPMVIAPAGGNGTNSPLWQLAAAIDNTRAGLVNADGLAGVFEYAGSILRTPQLTEQSPFLSGLNATNQISDAMYEWLPQQIMSLLRVGTPRYVIYSYGQALKPAKSGINLSAQNFGAVTNYQVAAEIATRAVVRLDTTRTNAADGTVTVSPPHAVIESFNVLPPD